MRHAWRHKQTTVLSLLADHQDNTSSPGSDGLTFGGFGKAMEMATTSLSDCFFSDLRGTDLRGTVCCFSKGYSQPSLPLSG